MGKKPKKAVTGPEAKKHKEPFLDDFALDMPINLVWVKVGSDPWWPSRVSSASEVEEVAEGSKRKQPRIYKDMKRLLKRQKEDGVFVFFYGEGTYAFVNNPKCIEPFETNLKQYCVHRRVWGRKYEDNPDDPQENSPMDFATRDRQRYCLQCKKIVPIDEVKVVGCENCFGWTHIRCCDAKPANGEFFDNDEKYYCRKCRNYLNMPEIVRKNDDVKKQQSEKAKKNSGAIHEEQKQQLKNLASNNKGEKKRKRKGDKDNDKEVEDEEEIKPASNEYPNDMNEIEEKNKNKSRESGKKKRKRDMEERVDVAEEAKKHTISKKKRKGLSKLNDSLSESGSELMILKRKASDSVGSDVADLTGEVDDDRMICTDFEYMVNRINRYVPGSVAEGLRNLLKEDMDKWFLNIFIIGSCNLDDISDLRKLLDEHVLRHGQWKWGKDVWKKHDMYGEMWSVLVKESYKVLRKLMKKEDLSSRNLKMICNEVLATLLGYLACKNKLAPGVTALERKETDEIVNKIEELRDQNKKLFKREVTKLFQEHGYSIDKNLWEEDKCRPVYFSIRCQISNEGAFWPEKKPRSLSRKNVFTALGFYNGVKRVNREVSKVSLADYQSNIKNEESVKVKETSMIRIEEQQSNNSESESAKLNEEKDVIKTAELCAEERAQVKRAEVNADENHAQNNDQGQDSAPNDRRTFSPVQEKQTDHEAEPIVSKQPDNAIQQNERINKTVRVDSSANLNNLQDRIIEEVEEREMENIEERNMSKSIVVREDGSEVTNTEELPKQNQSDKNLKVELENHTEDVQAAAAVNSSSDTGISVASYDPNEESERVAWFSDALNTRVNKVLSRTFHYPIPGSSRYIPGAERKAFNYYGGFLTLPEYKLLTTVHVHSITGGVIPEDSLPVLPDEHGFQQPDLDWWGVEECDLSSGSESDGEESC